MVRTAAGTEGMESEAQSSVLAGLPGERHFFFFFCVGSMQF